MKERSFDIFSGKPDKDPVWLEVVRDLSDALARMHEIAAATPGKYFVFSSVTHTVVAQTETYQKPDSARAKSASEGRC